MAPRLSASFLLCFAFFVSSCSSQSPSLPSLAHEFRLPSSSIGPVKDNQALLYRVRSSLHRLAAYSRRRLLEIVEIPSLHSDNLSQPDGAMRKEGFGAGNGVVEKVRNPSGSDSPDEAQNGGGWMKNRQTLSIGPSDNGKGSSGNNTIPAQQSSEAPAPPPLATNNTHTEAAVEKGDKDRTHMRNKTQPSTTNGTKDPENAALVTEDKNNTHTVNKSTSNGTKELSCSSQVDDKDCNNNVCLRTSRDGDNTVSLFTITNEGGNNVSVKVVTPEFLQANCTELMVKNGTEETVSFMKIETNTSDPKGAKSVIVTISTGYEKCIEVPIVYLNKHPSFGIPMAGVYMAGVYMLLVVLFMVAVIWLVCRYRRRKRSGDGVKYQELVPGMRTPKEEESTDGWNEIWDDDWEDTEAARSSSRIIKSLSSRGSAARRGNKDEWDNTWDD